MTNKKVYFWLTFYVLLRNGLYVLLQNILKVRVKSKWTIFILLACFAISLVNNSFKQVNPQKKNAPIRKTVPEHQRLWEGWVGSFTILFALLEHRVRKISRMEGRGAPMIFAAVFTVRWRVLRSAALQFRTRQ